MTLQLALTLFVNLQTQKSPSLDGLLIIYFLDKLSITQLLPLSQGYEVGQRQYL